METYNKVRFIIKVSKVNGQTYIQMEDLYWHSFSIAVRKRNELSSGDFSAVKNIESALALCKKSAKNIKDGIWGVEVKGYPFGKSAELVAWNFKLPNRAWR